MLSNLFTILKTDTDGLVPAVIVDHDAEENIYHKGFVVDVNLQTRGGKPVAYAITHVHQVIDLPQDEE